MGGDIYDVMLSMHGEIIAGMLFFLVFLHPFPFPLTPIPLFSLPPLPLPHLLLAKFNPEIYKLGRY